MRGSWSSFTSVKQVGRVDEAALGGFEAFCR